MISVETLRHCGHAAKLLHSLQAYVISVAA